MEIVKYNMMIHNFNKWKKLNESKNNNFNSLIDYTHLTPNVSVDKIKQICDDAKENNFYSVCVLPDKVSSVSSFLEDSDIQICTVIALPDGTDNTNKKIKDTIDAMTNGVDEIDMVMDYKSLKELSTEQGEGYENKYNKILEDIRNVTKVCHSDDSIIIKIIIEIEELNYEQIKLACNMCEDAGVNFIQTSTGNSKKEINFEEKVEKIQYMRKLLPEYIKIKISGGIRNIEQIEEVLPFVDRIGTSIIIG